MCCRTPLSLGMPPGDGSLPHPRHIQPGSPGTTLSPQRVLGMMGSAVPPTPAGWGGGQGTRWDPAKEKSHGPMQ